jgi:hypothetical protein
MKTALSSSGDVSVQGKGMTQFLVVGDGEEWTMKTETQALGCYTDRVRAIAAAIDLAEAKANWETGAQVVSKTGDFSIAAALTELLRFASSSLASLPYGC